MKANANRIYHPKLYDLETPNQRALHSVVNNIINEMERRPGELGGWSDPQSAQESRSMLKALATVLYSVVPHASAFKSLGHILPAILVHCTEPVSSLRKDIPKKFTQEMCQAQHRALDRVIQNPHQREKQFKLNTSIQQLYSVLGAHSVRLRKQLGLVKDSQSQSASTQAP